MQLLFAYFCNTQENQKKFIIICLHHNADSYLKLKAYVVVQFYPWLKFSFLLFLGMLMYDNNMIMSLKQKERKFEPRIKLNHNTYIKMCTHKWSKNIGRKTLTYLGVFTFLMFSQNDVDHQKSTSKTSFLCCLHFSGHVKWNS